MLREYITVTTMLYVEEREPHTSSPKVVIDPSPALRLDVSLHTTRDGPSALSGSLRRRDQQPLRAKGGLGLTHDDFLIL